MSEQSVAAVSVRYAVRPALDAWVLPEGPVPESTTHDTVVTRLAQLLGAWVRRSEKDARVARNLAIRWMKSAPAVGVDPDVCLIDPAPPQEHLRSLKMWEPGHVVPRVCFEVVSEIHPYKDYATIQDRYAAMGTDELVVFDPLLSGPAALGGPVSLQVWRRNGEVLERAHFGPGPAFSEQLDAWLHPVGESLEIADDRGGRERWLTGEEYERREKERARSQKDLAVTEAEGQRAEAERERTARLELERRLTELEEKMRRG
jgi:Uma2 family endonuclease